MIMIFTIPSKSITPKYRILSLAFDFLRDNMLYEEKNKKQRSLNFAIVDEVDSILIDEARTPLIISGPVDETNESYNQMRPVVEAKLSTLWRRSPFA